MKLYKFYGNFCAPCKALTTLLESTQLSIPVVPIDIEDDPEDLVTEYRIRNVPTLVLVDDNEVELSRVVGSASEEAIKKMIQKYE